MHKRMSGLKLNSKQTPKLQDRTKKPNGTGLPWSVVV